MFSAFGLKNYVDFALRLPTFFRLISLPLKFKTIF